MATRTRTPSLNTSHYVEPTTNDQLDIRGLAQRQARYRQEQKRDWFATRGYREIVQEVWNQRVSEDAEQRPLLIGEPETGWLSGDNVLGTGSQEILAVRGGTMGANINTRFKTWTAPEGGLVSWFMALRTPPVFEQQGNPYASTEDWDYADYTGDPDILRKRPPQNYKHRQFIPHSEVATATGTYPAGQQLRTGWNALDSNFMRQFGEHGFPVQETTQNPADWRYHTSVKNAFLSSLFGDAIMTLRFNLTSHSVIPDIDSSIFSGA